MLGFFFNMTPLSTIHLQTILGFLNQVLRILVIKCWQHCLCHAKGGGTAGSDESCKSLLHPRLEKKLLPGHGGHEKCTQDGLLHGVGEV